MTLTQLKQSFQVRYVNVAVLAAYSSGMTIPGYRTGMIVCTAAALITNVIGHLIAARTGQYQRMVYLMFWLDLLTVIPAIFFTGMASSPLVLVLLPILYTTYFIEFNKRYARIFGLVCLMLWASAYGLWVYRDVGAEAWSASKYPGYTTFVFGVQFISLAAAVHASTYLPDPLLQERDRQGLELERQHHRAELGVSLAMVVHELRNPLTAMGARLEIAREHLRAANGNAHPGMARAVDQLVDDQKRMRGMLDTLLDYARDRRGVPVREPVDLRETLNRALEFARLKHGKHKVHVTIAGPEAPRWTDGEWDALFRVLVNLIDNALTAEVPGRRLEIAVALSTVGDLHEITIRDNGCGMSAALAEQVFTPFVSERASGTGLGMPIARRIVKDHGGTIDLTSVEGMGTAVRIMLPVRPASPSPQGVPG